jgi:AcrR family transcriptional regulator
MSSRAGILSEAVRLFGDKGYPGTSMRDIATAVGLLPGSLYAHIEDKEGLLGEIVEEGIDRFLAAGELVVASTEPPADRLRALIKVHVGIIAENVQLTQVVFHQWKYMADARRQVVVEKRRSYEALFALLIDEGVQAGAFRRSSNPRIAVLAILGMLNWVPEWLSPGPESVDEIGDRLADVVLGGLAAP